MGDPIASLSKENVVVDFSPPTKSRGWRQKCRRSNLAAPMVPLGFHFPSFFFRKASPCSPQEKGRRFFRTDDPFHGSLLGNPTPSGVV
jgi:hypothetical protein